MIKKLLIYASLLWATGIMAQQEKVIPPFSEMSGDYIIVNSKDYEGKKNISEIKFMNINADKDSLTLSGFYIKGCPSFHAKYDETNGNIIIPYGTLIYVAFGDTYRYLYLWDDKKEEVIQKDIIYYYKGNNMWEAETTLIMMVGTMDGELSPVYFSQGSKIYRSNGKTENVSFAGWGQDQQRFDESRPSYVMIDNQRITIYNMLQADQFEYGCKMEGTYNSETGEAIFLPVVIGQSNEGIYRVLMGCIVDEKDNKPLSTTNPNTSKEGQVIVKVDMERGTLDFDPMAIWPASLDVRGGLIVDKTRYFEFVKTVKVSFDPAQAVGISYIPEDMTSMGKEVEKIEYYDITGRKVIAPQLNNLYIQKVYYKDNTSISKKTYIK